MKLPKMNHAERAVFAACYANASDRIATAADNSNAELALDAALWELECFRQAVRNRQDES